MTNPSMPASVAAPLLLAAANSDDAFVEILGDLKTALTNLQGVNPLVGAAHDVAGDVASMFSTANDLISMMQAGQEAITALESILPSLSEIPIVGEIIDLIDSVIFTVTDGLKTLMNAFNAVKDTVIDPGLELFQSIHSGLGSFQETANFLTVNLPQYCNTVQVLGYLVQIAEDVAPYLKGTDPGNRLASYIGTLQTVSNATQTALKPVACALNTAMPVLTAIGNDLKGVGQSIMAQMNDPQSTLGRVLGFFESVSHGMHSVIDAIAPLRWVLDAISWIFDHVLKPVIDAVLEATGLQSLINEFGQWITGKLGFGSLATLIRGATNPTVQQSGENTVGLTGAQAMQSNSNALGSMLGQFMNHNNQGLKQQAVALLSSLTGTAIDPSKPIVIPKWPLPPQYQQAAPQGAAARVMLPGPSRQVRNAARLRCGFEALGRAVSSPPATTSTTTPAAAPAPVPPLWSTLGTTPLPAAWQPVQTLLDDLAAANSALAASAPVPQNLSTQLSAYTASDTLPQDLTEQAQDFAGIFQALADLLGFVEQYVPVASYVDPVKAALVTQAQQAQALVCAVQAFATATGPIQTAVQQVLKAAPLADALAATQRAYNAWSLGGGQLTTLVDQGYAIDTGGKFTAQLDALRDAVNAAATGAAPQVQQVARAAQGVLTLGATIGTGLAGYIAQLQSLQGHSQLIGSQAMPALTQATHILGTLDSILDPLAGVLQDLGCSPKGTDIKSLAAAQVSAFRNVSVGAVQGYASQLTGLFDNLLETALPIDAITQNVQAVTQALANPAFLSACGSLAQAMAQLSAAQAPTQSYTTSAAQGSLTVGNLFVSQALVDQAQALFQQIAAAYPPPAHPLTSA